MEDQTILLDSLASAIDAEDDFTVVDKLSDAAAIHASVRIHPVDLVLMDVVTENSSGLSESAKLKQDHPNLKVVIFTAMPDAAFVQEAQEAGVDSFVYKSFPPPICWLCCVQPCKATPVSPAPPPCPVLAPTS